MGVHESVKGLEEKTRSVLANKPIWIFWLVYSGISGLLFGIFYTVTYLLALRWWVPILVMIVIGVIWGSFAFTRSSRPEKTE